MHDRMMARNRNNSGRGFGRGGAIAQPLPPAPPGVVRAEIFFRLNGVADGRFHVGYPAVLTDALPRTQFEMEIREVNALVARTLTRWPKGWMINIPFGECIIPPLLYARFNRLYNDLAAHLAQVNERMPRGVSWRVTQQTLMNFRSGGPEQLPVILVEYVPEEGKKA